MWDLLFVRIQILYCIEENYVWFPCYIENKSSLGVQMGWYGEVHENSVLDLTGRPPLLGQNLDSTLLKTNKNQPSESKPDPTWKQT
ncbi:hypothetical protein QVD17_38679 [Tagetes erecta]|uniref:Uncharacterized protein n=1 Tax=Tagetes erecta TaxID=13708 RepID=A0AAD8JPB9_TARER|nr:hypothetical protein QVD17_38679 [Tagetes erecta]